jgi:hypothetical protein
MLKIFSKSIAEKYASKYCSELSGYGLDDKGSTFQQELEIFILTTTSRPALEPTHPSVQWVLGVLSPEVKQQGHEADHSPTSSAKIKNVWSSTSSPPVYGVLFN